MLPGVATLGVCRDKRGDVNERSKPELLWQTGESLPCLKWVVAIQLQLIAAMWEWEPSTIIPSDFQTKLEIFIMSYFLIFELATN